MPYLFVENFEAGLDTRKSAFTAPPGSLRTFKNAHITRGKEIERRKAFAVSATLPAGTLGLHSVQDQLFVFGSAAAPASMPPTVQYQQLTSPNGGTLVDVLAAENFNGKIYAIGEFGSGSIHHFYDGVLVQDWETLAADIGSKNTVANRLGARLDRDGVADVRVIGDRIIMTSAVAGTAFAVTVTANMTVAERQAAAAAQPEVQAVASFDITGGTTGQTFNTISSVMLDGADLIGSAVDYDTDNATTAAAVAERINAGTSSYSASSSLGTVTVTAPAGLGSAANGRVLTVETTGDVTVANVANMAGGSDPVPAVPQITDAYVSSYASTGLYTVTLDGVGYSIRGDASAMPAVVRAIKQKMYAVTGSLLHFSGFADNQPDPTQWINDDTGPPVVIGAGFINMGTQYAGSEELTALGVYQGRVAAFSRRAVQIWDVDPDPALNAPYQVLLNVGSIAPGSVIEYGDLDIFFLSESGVRSMRARDSSNLASASDVGVAIDGELAAYLRTVTRRQVRDASAVVEPNDSRYLLAIGGRIYVFSNFPGSKVAAWSTYELGGEVTAWAVVDSRLHCRVGDNVRLYGGASGDEYDSSETELALPFLDGSNPAGRKALEGLDAGCEGTWKVEVATEPNNPDARETIAVLTESTYGSVQRVPVRGKTTHFSVRLTTSEPEPALLGNLILHYRDIKAE